MTKTFLVMLVVATAERPQSARTATVAGVAIGALAAANTTVGNATATAMCTQGRRVQSATVPAEAVVRSG